MKKIDVDTGGSVYSGTASTCPPDNPTMYATSELGVQRIYKLPDRRDLLNTSSTVNYK